MTMLPTRDSFNRMYPVPTTCPPPLHVLRRIYGMRKDGEFIDGFDQKVDICTDGCVVKDAMDTCIHGHVTWSTYLGFN